MNKRTRELWDKAAMDTAAQPSGHNPYETQVRFIDRFVELIVNECCQKLENDGMVESAIELKWHFGMDPIEKEITK